MSWLVLAAVLAQTSDAALTCQRIAHGGYERNPLLPKTCGGIVLTKAMLTAPVFVLTGRNRTIWASAMTVSGAAGVTLTLVWK